MRIDDNWNQEALDIIKNIDFNVLIPTLNRRYSYDELKEFDLVATCTTGVDHLEIRDIPIISLKGETEFLKDVHATAEMTWALIMALIRKVPWAFDDVKQGNWDRERWQGSELYNATLGVVGYGRIGKMVARYAEAFGMDILWSNTNKGHNEYFSCCYAGGESIQQSCFDNILRASDIISLHTPLNESTENMFSYDQFKLMKPTSLFINTSRGTIIDEEALIWVLENKIIAGAALDVVQNEPNINPTLIKYAKENTNLILTCHIGGNTVESRRKTQIFLANRIVDYIKNK